MIPKEAEVNSNRRMTTLNLLPVLVTETKDPEEAKEKERVRKHPPQGRTTTSVEKRRSMTLRICRRKWTREERSKKRNLNTAETARPETATETKVLEADSLAIAPERGREVERC